MEITTKKISELTPCPYNPRTISDEAQAVLTASICEYGYIDPIIWNKRTGNVVGGNMRMRVLEQQGIKEAEVVIVDLSLEKEKALNVALNNQYIAGSWTPNLGSLLEEIEASTPDLYTSLNLNSLLQDVPELEMEIPEGLTDPDEIPEGLTDPDEVPEAVEEPFVQEGDLITLGAHRLLCGNSIKAEDVKRLMNGQSPTLCLTDPPYCVNYENIKRRADEPTRKERGDAYEDPEDPRELLKFIDLIPCDIMVMTFPIGKHFHVLSDATREWDILYDCVWVKNNFAFNMRRRYQQKHEMILIMRRKKHEHIGNWNVPNNQSTVFEFDKPAANVDHPTIKPIGLYLLLARYHSNPGDLIYEPFCGSGTTMISAEQLGRTCYALELQPAYVQVAVQRWIDYTGRQVDVIVERDGKAIQWKKVQGEQ
jgi:DNA modification methylase